MTLNDKFQIPDNVAFRKVDKETVILDTDTSAYFSLNETGAAIWDSLTRGLSLAEARDELCGLFEVSGAAAEAEIGSLVEQLCKNKLLKKA